MSYQYQQFPSEPSLSDQLSSPQYQGQPAVQMQEMNPDMQNQSNYSYPPVAQVGQPITSYSYQTQTSNNSQYQQQQQNSIHPQQMQQFSQQPVQQYMLIPIKSPQQKLEDCHGIFVKQKLEVFEAITGFETENSYKVFQADINGTQVGDQPIFNCKEKSNCCHRQILAGSQRPFTMDVINVNGMISNGSLAPTPFLHFERPYKCTMCCYKRPELTITCYENGQSVFYGTLKNPFMCLELGCEVYDRNGILKYVIIGSCCELGYLCRSCPCKSCQEYLFEVKSPSGEILTRLQKKTAGFMKASISNADNFALGFPPNSTVEEKILLMAATLFLDYMYFEDKQQQKKNNNFKSSFSFRLG